MYIQLCRPRRPMACSLFPYLCFFPASVYPQFCQISDRSQFVAANCFFYSVFLPCGLHYPMPYFFTYSLGWHFSTCPSQRIVCVRTMLCILMSLDLFVKFITCLSSPLALFFYSTVYPSQHSSFPYLNNCFFVSSV